MAARLTDLQLSQIREDVEAGLNNTRIAAKRGIGRYAVIIYANRYREEMVANTVADIPEDQEQCPKEDQPTEITRAADSMPERFFQETGDKAKLDFKTTHPVRTMQDAIMFGDIDTKVWHVTTFKVKSWEVVIKNANKDGVLHHLWAVSLEMERVAPKCRLEALEAIFRDVESRAPLYPWFPTPKSARNSVALVICLFDAHFGKLAWKPECGEDSDLKIQENVYDNAIVDILDQVSHLNVEKIFFPVGQDGSHIDSPRNDTTGGTIVDTDGRFAKVIEVMERAKIRGVERAMNAAPVDVFHVPGNHDYTTSYHLVRTLAAWFRNTDRVTVDYSPMSRKYREYGKMLFGFIHGDKVSDSQVKSLMSLMMAEQREVLSRTKYSEWFLGHQHRARKFEQKSTDTYQGVVVRWINALSSTDIWHFDGMMVGTQHAAEVYIYDRELGYKGHFVSPVVLGSRGCV